MTRDSIERDSVTVRMDYTELNMVIDALEVVNPDSRLARETRHGLLTRLYTFRTMMESPTRGIGRGGTDV